MNVSYTKAEMKKWNKDTLIDFAQDNISQRNDLLEALKELLAEYTTVINSAYCQAPEDAEVTAKAKAAIKKAEE